MTSKIHIGTSGWSYHHWKENFYPEKLPQKKWLEYYSSHFSTVEINSTFYRLPSESTIKNWSLKAPSEFLFSIKVSRYITHQKKLKECKESLDYLFNLIKKLDKKLGPLLIQLPPSFKMDMERLYAFIQELSDHYRYVFEFRHDSWFVPEVYELLRKQKIALCITDLNGALSPEEITTDFTYLRLHGPKKAYQGSYGIKRLKAWKKQFEEWRHKNISIYCYFDNDEKGYAIQDALSLKSMLN